MIKGIYFKNVLKTVTTHTGTKVEYGIPRNINVIVNNGMLNEQGLNATFGSLCDKAKIVTFAEHSPMKKLGIDQAFCGHDKATGRKVLGLWQGNNCLRLDLISSNNKTNDIRNYLKVIKDLIDSGFKLPNISPK